MAARTRNDIPKRFRKFRDDSSIASATAQIESVYGLPKGSVRLVHPRGRKARTDGKVGGLRKKYPS